MFKLMNPAHDVPAPDSGITDDSFVPGRDVGYRAQFSVFRIAERRPKKLKLSAETRGKFRANDIAIVMYPAVSYKITPGPPRKITAKIIGDRFAGAERTVGALRLEAAGLSTGVPVCAI